MLANCVGINQICVDATYKLVWQGFPFLVVGTVDRAKKFHPLAFALTSTESELDFKFLFVAMKSTIEKLHDCEFCPRVLIADGALSIRNAFNAVFNADVMIMCYAHVVRNVSKRPVNNRKNMVSILNDMRYMNLASTVGEFTMLSKLFLKKYKKIEPEFAKYFQEQWLSGSHCNWFEAASIYDPSTNNNLEGIKQFFHCALHFRNNVLVFVNLFFRLQWNNQTNDYFSGAIAIGPIYCNRSENGSRFVHRIF